MALWDKFLPVTRGDFRKLEKKMEDQQGQIDAVVRELLDVKETLAATQANVATIATGVNKLETAQANLQKELDALKAASPLVNLKALQAAADSLKTQVSAVKGATDTTVADLADGPEETPVAKAPATPETPAPAAAAVEIPTGGAEIG